METTQDPEERLQLFYDLTSEYNNVNPRASIRFADSTIKWARKLGNEKREYQGQYARGAGFYFLGENDSAEKYVRLALDRALVMDIKPDIADSYNLLGAVLKNTGEFLQALESFQKGLLVSRELQDTTLIYTLLINQAEIYLQQGDLELSRNNYEEGLDLILATEGGESFAAAVVYNNLGELDNIPNDTALQFLSQAQEIFTSFGYVDGAAHTHSNMGDRYLEQEDYNRSIRQYQAAIDIWEQEATNYKPGLVVSYSGLAAAYTSLGNLTEARRYTDKAILLGEKFDLKPELEEAYFTRSTLE